MTLFHCRSFVRVECNGLANGSGYGKYIHGGHLESSSLRNVPEDYGVRKKSHCLVTWPRLHAVPPTFVLRVGVTPLFR